MDDLQQILSSHAFLRLSHCYFFMILIHLLFFVDLHGELLEQLANQSSPLAPLLFQKWRGCEQLTLLFQELLMPRLLLLDHHHVLLQIGHSL